MVQKRAVDAVGVDFLDRINAMGGSGRSRGGMYATGGEVATAVTTSFESVSYDKMKASFSEALQEMPNPVVSVKEITRTQKRVSAKEQLSKM